MCIAIRLPLLVIPHVAKIYLGLNLQTSNLQSVTLASIPHWTPTERKKGWGFQVEEEEILMMKMSSFPYTFFSDHLGRVNVSVSRKRFVINMKDPLSPSLPLSLSTTWLQSYQARVEESL